MKLAAISFTRTGAKLCQTLIQRLQEIGVRCTGYTGKQKEKTQKDQGGLQVVEGSLSAWTQQQFTEMDGLIFVGAAGIAVRLIAPCVKDKMTDPAVVVVDEAGRFSISLLSGHVGGANRLAEQVAQVLGAVPVVTTASDVQGKAAIDVWAKDHELAIADRNLAKEIAAARLDGEMIGFFSEYPSKLPDGTGYEKDRVCQKNVWVTCHLHRDEKAEEGTNPQFLRLVPKSLVLGIGCRKQTPEEAIETAVRETLKQANLDPCAVSAVASIDLKKEEPGLLCLAKKLGVPFLTYPSEKLEQVQGEFTESGFVKTVTGVGNVCERSALLAAGEGANLLVRKQIYPGVTVSVAQRAVRLEP